MKIVVSVWPGLGDVIFTTPVFRTIRKKFPDSWITALVWSNGGKELLRYNPYIDEIVKGSFGCIRKLISKFKEYDVGVQCSQPVQLLFMLSRIKRRVSFNGNPFWWFCKVAPNDFHSTEYYLQAVDKMNGIKLRDGNNWELFVTREEEEFAQTMLKSVKHPRIAIHPGVRNNSCKRWNIRKFVKLCDQLIEKFDVQIVLVGGESDIKLSTYIQEHICAKALNFAGTTMLLQSAAIIKQCDLFIGHASGPTYIAAAVGTPVVAILGPDDPKNFGPLGEKTLVVNPRLKCAPCLHFYRNFFWGLRLRYIPICIAMHTIQVNDVFNVCTQFLTKEQ